MVALSKLCDQWRVQQALFVAPLALVSRGATAGRRVLFLILRL